MPDPVILSHPSVYRMHLGIDLKAAIMCTPGCTCISCTASYGRDLASLLHTWHELAKTSNHTLEPLLYSIETTASALNQLHVIIDNDSLSPIKTFTPAGHQEIETLSIKSNLIFKALILLFQKAVDRRKESANEDESKAGSSEKKNSQKSRSRVFSGPVRGRKRTRKTEAVKESGNASDMKEPEEKDSVESTSSLLCPA
ncbi:unnamed protein product [Discula destructiva]